MDAYDLAALLFFATVLFLSARQLMRVQARNRRARQFQGEL